MKSTYFRLGLLFLGLCLWLGAVGVRRAVLTQQTRTMGEEEAPFLLEAALQYRMTRIVYEEGQLPRHEPRVQYPEGVNPWTTYSIGAEFLYAPLARLFPRDWTLTRRLRWVSTLIFALAVPIAALWAGLMWRSVSVGVFTGGMLMVSPAFVVRSSGLALSRENLAFPFLMLFLLCSQLVPDTASRRRLFWLCVAGISAGLSQMFWDFSQYLFGLWALWQWVTWGRGRVATGAERSLQLATGTGLAMAAILHPYLRHQGFLFSPVLMLVWGRWLAELPRLTRFPRWQRLLGCLAVAALWSAIGRMFIVNYGHFGELFVAKIRHLNVKPMDPSVLTYNQRIMWTPALNSSTRELTQAYFPFILHLSAFAVVLFLILRAWKQEPASRQCFYLGITFFLYVLFFRMHVFLIVFAAAFTAGIFMTGLRRLLPGKWAAALMLTLTLLLTGAESYRLLIYEPPVPVNPDPERAAQMRMLEQLGMITREPVNRWGHPGQSYRDVLSLVAQLQALEQPNAPVLAGFGISGPILTHTDMPILLHPKFESPGIRERVREFYEHLFLRSELAFRNWAVANGAQFYVHGLGSLAGGDFRDAPRYMVDALEPPDYAAVHVLERQPLQARWFQPVGGNDRFRIFRIIRPEDEEFSAVFMEMAFEAAARGDVESARRHAWRVLRDYDWKYEPARDLIELLGRPRDLP